MSRFPHERNLLSDRRGVLLAGAGIALLGAGAAATVNGMGSSEDYAAAIATQRRPLRGERAVHEAIRFATLAASGHNTQPWRFQIAPGAISIIPDMSRRTPVVDPDDHHLYVSLGCAAENLALAAAALGLNGELRFDPHGAGAIVFDHVGGAARASELCDAIPRRQSCRAEFDGRGVSPSDLARLLEAAETHGVDIAPVTEPADIEKIRDLVLAGNDAQMADPAFIGKLKSWMRFNPSAALARGDGLYSAASGNPVLPTWAGASLFDLVFNAEAENDKYARHLASSAGVMVFSAMAESPEHWISVGRACQRFALQATALGLKTAFINQPVEVASLRDDLAAIVGFSGRRPDIVMRFGYGPDLPMSPRRPIEAAIIQ